MKLGLMGGTFDPPHYGHLFIAEAARVQMALEKVLFIPNRIPAHRQGKIAHATVALRCAMTEAAIADNVHFELSRIELERTGPSYSYDTICHFRAQGHDVYYIIGSDSLHDLPTWHRSEELFDLCHFIVAPRPGHKIARGMAALNESHRTRILPLQAPSLEISSSEIRQRISHNFPVRYLLPDEVERVMRSHHLYQ